MTVVLSTGALPRVGMNWNAIDWQKVIRTVRRLQARIVKATQESRWGKVQALQRLLTRSYSGRCLAVRRVTENRGKKTAGVDGETWETPVQKSQAVATLRPRGYQAQPLRRVYIPKHGNPQKLRPLGIPTMRDRAMQALYLLALDPIAEAQADLNSYGFRRGRSTADAISQIFNVLKGKFGADRWILEGDIKGCFDHISHSWLQEHIPMEKPILRQWLKAGYLEKTVLHPTEAGTPQGGIISPTLMNMTLDGLERELQEHFGPRKSNNPTLKVNFCRYADDFVVIAGSRERLEQDVVPFIANFLQERGLELSAEKTCITSAIEGFDFLGQNVRQRHGKLIIQPSKTNRQTFLKHIRETIKSHPTATAGNLILLLNPIIRGWANYHRHVCSKRTYSYCNFQIFRALWQWARRRHPHKGARWIERKYFRKIGTRNWTFSGEIIPEDGPSQSVHLIHMDSIHIQRHVKVRGAANPYDPMWELYFEQRQARKLQADLKTSPKALYLWSRQQGRCPRCGSSITEETGWHLHHKVWRSLGGADTLNNLELLHLVCHQQLHCQDQWSEAPCPDKGHSQGLSRMR